MWDFEYGICRRWNGPGGMLLVEALVQCECVKLLSAPPPHQPTALSLTVPYLHALALLPQRIDQLEEPEPGKIPVAGPKLSHPVNVTESSNPGVVDLWSLEIESRNQTAELFREIFRLFEKPNLRGACEFPECLQSRGWGSRLWKYFGMGHHGVKFVQAGPRDRPPGSVGRHLFQTPPGLLVPHAVHAMGVNQQVGVNGDQKSDRIHETPQRFPVH